MHRNHYGFSRSVRGALLFSAIVMMLLVLTIPVGIYFLLRRRSAKLSFHKGGFTVQGLGSTQRWQYAELERIGLLSVEINGAGPLVALNGGRVAHNFCARTRAGKKLKFVISRFASYEEVLQRVEQESGLPLESVGMGAFGPSWPERSTAHP